MRDALQYLTDEQVNFIKDELGLSKDELFSLDEDALYDVVYDRCCVIEEIETVDAMDRKSEEMTDRGRIAADIVTLLGNSLYDEDNE